MTADQKLSGRKVLPAGGPVIRSADKPEMRKASRPFIFLPSHSVTLAYVIAIQSPIYPHVQKLATSKNRDALLTYIKHTDFSLLYP